MKLISMTDFVLDKYDNHYATKDNSRLTSIYNYAQFLKQPLGLWMFCPVDEGGKIIPKPEENMVPNMPFDLQYGYWNEWNIEYQKAKERCFFEGFHLKDGYDPLKEFKVIVDANDIVNVFWWNKIDGWYPSKGTKNIEDLVEFDLQLTPTALKQIGL